MSNVNFKVTLSLYQLSKSLKARQFLKLENLDISLGVKIDWPLTTIVKSQLAFYSWLSLIYTLSLYQLSESLKARQLLKLEDLDISLGVKIDWSLTTIVKSLLAFYSWLFLTFIYCKIPHVSSVLINILSTFWGGLIFEGDLYLGRLIFGGHFMLVSAYLTKSLVISIKHLH